MPWINKVKAKTPKIKRHFSNREKRQEIYNTKQWKDLRKQHLMNHPTCYLCENEGRVRLASQCHHIVSPFSFNEQLIKEYAYDPDNLISLCRECHTKIHTNKEEAKLHELFYEKKRLKFT